MNSKLLVAGGLVLAFVLGTAASGITTAFNRPEEPAAVVEPQPAVRTAPRVVTRQAAAVRPQVVTRYVNAAEPVSEPVVERKQRSMKEEILIVGGSAAGGAAIGAVAGGKKGAAIGAISGGVAGLIYDMATRNK